MPVIVHVFTNDRGFEEGKKIRDNLNSQKKLLENIKEKKLDQLNSLSIPGKYTAELAKKKINI